MHVLPRNLRLAAVAAFATTIIAVSAFAPAKKAPLSPRFNHVMLIVSNLDSSVAFYTAAFDLKVAQRITELSVTPPNGTPTAHPVKMALLKFPGQEFVLEMAERPAPGSGSAAVLPAPRRRRSGHRGGSRAYSESRRAGSHSHPDRQYVDWNCREEHVLRRTQRRARRAHADRFGRVLS